MAAGGNGLAAKSSDEVGRIAAEFCVTREWTSDIPKSDMNVKWETNKKIRTYYLDVAER